MVVLGNGPNVWNEVVVEVTGFTLALVVVAAAVVDVVTDPPMGPTPLLPDVVELAALVLVVLD